LGFELFGITSSTVSGGGIMLSNSNSATTLGGRNDLDESRRNHRTSAIVNQYKLVADSAVSTSFLAATDLPRFEI